MLNRNANNTVIAWINGETAKTPNNSLRTDGSSLYSYALEIGYTDANGNKVARDYTGVYSRTTNTHVALAKGNADIIESVGQRVQVVRTVVTSGIPMKSKPAVDQSDVG